MTRAVYRPGDRIRIRLSDRSATVRDPAYTAGGHLRIEFDADRGWALVNPRSVVRVDNEEATR